MHKANSCPTMFAFNKEGVVVPVYCGQWKCKHCARRLALEWSKRAYIEVRANGQGYYFLTLTLGSRYKTALQGFRDLPRLWDAIRKWVERALHGRAWHYMAFVEGQPKRSHMPHFHIIASISIAALATEHEAVSLRKRYEGRKNIREKDWAVARGLGFQAKEEVVNDEGAARYVSKYATKQHPQTPKGFRRVRVSQNWAKLPLRDVSTLYVKSRNEFLAGYIVRVSNETGVDAELLYSRWKIAVGEEIED